MNDYESRQLVKYTSGYNKFPETALVHVGYQTYFNSKGKHVNPLGIHNVDKSYDLAINFHRHLSKYLHCAVEVLKNKEEFQYIRGIFEGLHSSYKEEGFVCIETEDDCTYMKYLKDCPLRWFIYALGSHKVQIYEDEIEYDQHVKWQCFIDERNEFMYFSSGTQHELVLTYWQSSNGRIYVYTVDDTLYTWI